MENIISITKEPNLSIIFPIHYFSLTLSGSQLAYILN